MFPIVNNNKFTKVVINTILFILFNLIHDFFLLIIYIVRRDIGYFKQVHVFFFSVSLYFFLFMSIDTTYRSRITELLCKSYDITRSLPEPLIEPEDNSQKGSSSTETSDKNNIQSSHKIEDWEKFKIKYYNTIIDLSKTTNQLLELSFPIYILHHARNGAQVTKIIKDLNISPSDVFTLIKQSRIILGLLDRYMVTTHYLMPSWRILNTQNHANTKTPMEICLFYEICKMRVITNFFDILTNYVPGMNSREKELNASINILHNLKILPPNINKWNCVYPYKHKPSNEMIIQFYSQSQLENSFKHLFLKLNLISAGNEVLIYIDEILARMASLAICAYPAKIMDIESFRSTVPKTILNNIEDKVIFNTDIIEDMLGYNMKNNLLDDCFSRFEKDCSNLFIFNQNYVVRLILRYIEILRKTIFRTIIFKPERILKPPDNVKMLSKWIQSCLNNKFEKVNQLLRAEIFEKYSNLLLPPSDPEWAAYYHSVQYISENSVWSILYPELKEFINETANKNIKTIYYEPNNNEITIVEYIVLKLFHMIFASNFNFWDFFVLDQQKLIKTYVNIIEERKMPILIQSFNRFNLLIRQIDGTQLMLEYPSIFDTLAGFIIKMIEDFGDANITFCITETINKLRKNERVDDENSSKNQKTINTQSNEFSSVKTRMDTEDDDAGKNRSFF